MGGVSGYRYLADRVIWDGEHSYVAVRKFGSWWPYLVVEQEAVGDDYCHIIGGYRFRWYAVRVAKRIERRHAKNERRLEKARGGA